MSRFVLLPREMRDTKMLDKWEPLSLARLAMLLVLAEGTILPTRMLQDLNRRTNATMEKYEEMEERILSSRTHLQQGSPSWYLGASHEMSAAARTLSRRALRSETMAVMLVEALKMTPKEAASLLPTVGLGLCTGEAASALHLTRECQKVDPRFRTHTGRCNNPLHPAWGAALEPYSRLLPAEYTDGVSLPRRDLPSARKVSLMVHAGTSDSKHPFLMALVALFGQFLANDLAHTPRMELSRGKRLKCCDVEFEHFHPECFPIGAENSVHCMEYSRSAPHPGNTVQGCKLGPRQQINQATSYVDLSPVYGNSEEISKSLRSGKGGTLMTQRKNLPMPSESTDECRSPNAALPCFLGGDSRVNEHPGLTLMHVLFLREHNRVAKQLEQLNPHWDDDRLYQEARRVVIAEMQHITYNEYLPVVLGENALDRYQLRLNTGGLSDRYDSRVDASLSNAGASAGLFFAAVLTPKTLDLVDLRSSSKSGERSLLSSFYAPQELYEAGAIDRLIAGATAGHSRKPLPPGLNEVLLSRYFHDGKSSETPVDYAAQAIQEGRDHGLPPYVRWKHFCDLVEVTDFRDLEGTIAEDALKKLRSVYEKVEDVDLLTGALSEAPVEGAVLGPTFLCLLGRVFRNARLGDRYWYENVNTPGAFTPVQIEEIRKSTIARILCDNGDNLKRIQPRAFILHDRFLNNLADCTSYLGGGLDLTPWKETQKTPEKMA
ncbi:peroxidasin-like protein [Orussus abietinus]|uniref:peroxidasin-like protein n=1 Tax=Orussus abietinus TaxID=222816 RepID=UPI0006268C45|nr:peroxidasin-like protein [Orussus abietinus]